MREERGGQSASQSLIGHQDNPIFSKIYYVVSLFKCQTVINCQKVTVLPHHKRENITLLY